MRQRRRVSEAIMEPADYFHAASRGRVFWIDLDNPYCVTFFYRIIERLRELGHSVYVTYRDGFGIEALLSVYGVSGEKIGCCAGASRVLKSLVALKRAFLLKKWARGKPINFALSFGSRSQVLCCGLLGSIPSAIVFDYEYVSMSVFNWFCQWMFVPVDISTDVWKEKKTPLSKLVKFSGLKESVYVLDELADHRLLRELGINAERAIAVLRPPAVTAHYHDKRSEVIFRKILERIADDRSTFGIIVPRRRNESYKLFLTCENIIELPFSVKGPGLIGASDLVISGGGTMVREAAVLGVPAYSVFTGRLGAIDRRLSREGRLLLVRDLQDVDRILFRKRIAKEAAHAEEPSLLEFFVDNAVSLAKQTD